MRVSVCAALFLSAAGVVFAQNSHAQAAKPVVVDFKKRASQNIALQLCRPQPRASKSASTSRIFHQGSTPFTFIRWPSASLRL